MSSTDSLAWQILRGELDWDVPGGMHATISIPISWPKLPCLNSGPSNDRGAALCMTVTQTIIPVKTRDVRLRMPENLIIRNAIG